MGISPGLQQWCDKAERLKNELGDEYWKMQVGLPYSKDRIGSLEKENGKNAALFLAKFKEPFPLLLDATDSVASEKTFELYLELDEAHKTKIVSRKHTFQGKPVTWKSWRQFASSASDEARKEVFDEFIGLTDLINPIITKRFGIILDVYRQHGLDPLGAYCQDHRMSLKTLKRTMQQLRDGCRHEFVRQWAHYTEELLGRKPAYYDDFYFMRNAVFSKLPHIKVDPIASMLRTAKELSFDTSRILLDKEDRPDKYASPFCSFVKVPTDVRVSYKPENPVNDLSSVYHEYGHALHATSIRADLPYWDKYVTNNGLNETFSILFESIIHDTHYLHHQLGIDEAAAEDIVRRLRFARLYSVAFYAANSLFRIESWEKKVPFEDWDALYAKYIKECMGIDMPGNYWQLHHILPESVMYVPSYLLADIRAVETVDHCHNEWGREWWREKAAGVHIKNLMKDGAQSPAGTFEDINPKEFIADLIRRD